LSYSNGGHPGPLWFRVTTGECQKLRARGFLLGAFTNIELEERQIDVFPGDLLLFCTDGVTEARNAAGQMFGDGRLQTAIETNPNAGAPQVLQAVVNAVRKFVGDRPQSDDLTIFVVKRQRAETG
jgi:sigma-B regulation protein RsbU (phosphoserine phosphatase)